MPWHLQITKLTARWFDTGEDEDASFAARKKPDVLAQVDLEASGRAYIHAAMSRADGATKPGIWRELARKLREMGVTVLEWEHKSRASSVDPARAWCDTVAVER